MILLKSMFLKKIINNCNRQDFLVRIFKRELFELLVRSWSKIGIIISLFRITSYNVCYTKLLRPTASDGLEFDAVTAAVLGGIAMMGGKGSLGGALIGLMILQGFNNGLLMLNVQSFWQTVARGLLLVAALTFDYIRNRKNK